MAAAPATPVRTPSKGAPANGKGKPLSLVAAQIVEKAVKEDVTVAALSALAIGDPGFAARVLALVNSAAFGMGRTISEIGRACAMLGVRGVRNIALSLVLSDMVPTGQDGTVLLTVSVRRAVAARLLAAAVKTVPLDDAFTTGLFLELGLLSHARLDLPGAAQIARMPAAHRPVVERSFGIGEHAAVGAELGRTMHLPETILEAVLHHHDAQLPAAPLARIAWAAERVAGAWEGGDSARVKADADAAMLALGIAPELAGEILRDLPGLVTSAASSFDRRIDVQTNLEQLAVDAHAQLVEMNNGYEQLVRRLEALLQEKEALARQLGRANADLANMAATDSLTGLANKRAFDQSLRRDLSRTERAGQNLALLVMDIDFFKAVNDTHGHAAGDAVLAKVGAILRAGVRVGDVAARCGGEEFMVILPDSDAAGACKLAERLRGAVESAVIPGPTGAIRVTASFGVGHVEARGASAKGAELVERADAALYRAKRSGRNRVVAA
jgi:two-component system, cell cycle response regulator